MAQNWFYVGGDTGRAGNKENVQAPVDENVEQKRASQPEVPTSLSSAPEGPSYFDDPRNIGKLYVDVLANPELRNDPSLDFNALSAAHDYLLKANGNKPFTEWKPLAADDPAQSWLKTLPVPEAYKSVGPDGKPISASTDTTLPGGLQTTAFTPYTPTPDAEVGPAKPAFNSPLEETVAGLLPAAGKTMAVVGMAAQGASMGPLGALAGAAAGAAMSNPGEKDTFISKALQTINAPVDFLETLIGADLQNSPEIKKAQDEYYAKVREGGKMASTPVVTTEAKAAMFQDPGSNRQPIIPQYSDAEKQKFSDQWRAMQAAGKSTYDTMAAQGLLSVPGKALSLISERDKTGAVGKAGASLATMGATKTSVDDFDAAWTDVIAPSLKDAWERRNEVWGWTRDDVWKPGQDEATKAAYMEIYNRVMADPRADADAIADEVKQRFGLGGVMMDLVGQIVMDPLNLVGPGMVQGAKLMAGSSDVTRGLSKAFRLAGEAKNPAVRWIGGFADAVDNPVLLGALEDTNDLLTGLRKYGADIQAGGEEAAARYGAVSRLLAGVDKTGKYTRFAPTVQDGAGKFKQVMRAAVMGTRESRAAEFLHHVSQNLAGDLVDLDNTDDIVKLVDQVAQMAPADAVETASKNMVGRWADNVMSQSAPIAVRSSVPKIKILKNAFERTRDQAKVFEALANKLGMNPRKMVSLITEAEDMAMEANFQFWRSKLGKLAAEGDTEAASLLTKLTDGPTLKTQAQIFDGGKHGAGIPLNLDEFKAHTMNILSGDAENFAIKYFGVKPYGTAWQLANTIKKVQGLLLLGLNPAYAMNNMINNATTLMWDGLLRLNGLEDRGRFLQEWGMPILKLGQGSLLDSASGSKYGNRFLDIADRGHKIRTALQSEGMLGKISEGVGEVSSKVSLAAMLSNFGEQKSSELAMISALKEVFPKMWQPDAGFDSLAKVAMSDGASLADKLDAYSPGLSTRIESAIKHGLTREQIESRIFGNPNGVGLQDVLTADETAMFDRFPAVADALRDGLAQAKTKQDILDTVGSAQRRMEESILREVAESASQWANETAARVVGEGAHAVLDIMDTLGDQVSDFTIDHFRRMGDAAEEAKFLRSQGSPEAARAVWSEARAEASRVWAIERDRQQAKMVGLARGLGEGDESVLAIRESMQEIGDTWEKFYADLDELYKTHEVQKSDDPFEVAKAFDKMQAEMDRKYQAALGREADAQGKLDKIFAEMFERQFPGSKREVQKWRKVSADARYENSAAMAYFRGSNDPRGLSRDIVVHIDEILDGQELNWLSYDQRNKAWERFVHEIYEPMIARREAESKALGARLVERKVAPIMSAEEKSALRQARLEAERLYKEYDEALAATPERPAPASASPAEAMLPPEDAVPAEVAMSPAAELPNGPVEAAAPDAPIEAAPIGKEQTVRAISRMLRGFPDLEKATPYGLVKVVNKYLDKSYRSLEEVSFAEAQIVVQRRAAARALNLRGKDSLTKLRSVEKRLGISIEDYMGRDSTLEAMVSPLGSVTQMHPAMPYKDAVVEGYLGPMRAAFTKARQSFMAQEMRDWSPVMRGLPEDLRLELNKYLQATFDQLKDTKQAAVRVAEGRRDFALLDYNDRYGLDNVAGAIMPYQFWYTRSMRNWFLRIVTRPNILRRYAVMANAGNNVPSEDLPTRFQGKIKLNIPYLPDELGDGVYVDVMRQLFPMLQIAKPFVQLSEDTNLLNKRTQGILSDKLANEEITQAEYDAAMQGKDDVWGQAYAQAKIEIDSDIRNPGDFVNALSGFSLPLNWAWQAGVMGTPERISPLPITRTIQSLSYMAGRAAGLGNKDGVNIEAPIRKALGQPTTDRYYKYGLSRAFAAMAFDAERNGGKVTLPDGTEITATPDDFRRAQIDNAGPLYDAAVKRMSDTSAMKLFGSPVGTEFYQRGEAGQRALGKEYAAARSSGDPSAYKKFNEAHPEYAVQKDAWRPETDRIKNYMKDTVWVSYYNLSKADQQNVREQLGDRFTRLFMDPKTRDYSQLTTEELAMWSKSMGGKPTKGLSNIPAAPIKFASEAEASALGKYYEEISSRFENVQDTISKLNYYNVSPEEQEKLDLDYPEIKQYNEWRDRYLAQNPQIINRVIGKDAKAYGAPLNVQSAYYLRRAIIAQYFPGIYEQQNKYYSLPTKQAKAQFKAGTKLDAYWEWTARFNNEHRDAMYLWTSDEKMTNMILGDRAPKVTIDDVLNGMSPELSRSILNGAMFGEKVSPGAMSELDVLRKKYKPGSTLENFRDEIQAELYSRYMEKLK